MKLHLTVDIEANNWMDLLDKVNDLAVAIDEKETKESKSDQACEVYFDVKEIDDDAYLSI